MRKVDKAQKKLMSAQMTLALLPIMGVVSVIAGASAGIYLESWVAFWVVAAAIFFLVPIKLKNMSVNSANLKYKNNWDGVINSLKSPDYALTEIFGGIGIDTDNKQLSILHSEGKKNAEPTLVDFDDIEEYGITTGGENTQWVSLEAGSASEESQKVMTNAINQARYDAKTGVYVLLKDIHAANPRLIAPMTTQTAGRWLRLLEQAFNGELEKPKNSPSHYPADLVTE